MRKFLDKPYPFLHESPIAMIGLTVFTFLFVVGFLFTFTPFDIDEKIPGDKGLLEISAYFGIASAMSYLLFVVITKRILPEVFTERNWTVGKELLYTNVVLLLISVANALVGDYFNFDEELAEQSLAHILWEGIYKTYLVGLFPVALITVINNYVLLKRNLSRAQENQEVLEEKKKETTQIEVLPVKITIESQIKSNALTLDLNTLLFIASDGNYVEYYIQTEDSVNREIQRNTLTNIEKQLSEYDNFFRSHRAYLVNLNKISETSGNAQGYQLTFDCTDHIVPVSRTKLSSFDEVISTLGA